MFEPIDTRRPFPQVERETAQWWKEHGIIKKVLASGDCSRPFVFFEGPPTANGHPGVHTIEARVIKDVIIRYHRMCGQHVIGARGGWDTHGLPVELEVEKELRFGGKPDIERYGIAAFNLRCRQSVWRYVREFESLTERIAFWLDLENSYATCNNDYIESLWWILKTLWQKNLLYRDYKVTMHCPRCGTSLSDHEVAQGFRDDVDDPSLWIRFRSRPSGHPLDSQFNGASFLAWTTTPWTLPANAALAVKPTALYVLVEYLASGMVERLVLGKSLAEQVLGRENYTVLATFEGSVLGGVHYEPHFQGVAGPGESVDWGQVYRVVADDFVSLEDGSGIVHIAPAYGDLEIGRTYGLPTLFSVDLAGKMLPEFTSLSADELFFKQADPLIEQHLQERGLLFRSGRVRHSYPFCWRCDTPLLYYAKPSWYIRTTAYKEQLLRNNESVNWVPDHIKRGRFGTWLEHNIDWALSRERYWGTPLPIWICSGCEKIQVIGSVKELSDHVDRDLHTLDLHRPYIDEISWACEDCGHGTYRRIPDVADVWFDSGSMPVAQWHYPFENQEEYEAAAQADFIAEGIDQTRGWFYTLHAISTLLFERPAYKNVICLGHIMDAKGEKMSKSRGNMADPWQPLETYGADATRWFMYAYGPPYHPRNFTLDSVGEMQRQFFLTLWNTCAFFVTYANVDGWRPPYDTDDWTNLELPLIDRWVLARLNVLVGDVTEKLDRYDIYSPTKEIERFVDDLSNRYVRHNRRRFWKAENDQDKQAAYVTLYTCLTTLGRLLAPFAPFISEAIYRNFVSSQDSNAPESVHQANWPQVNAALIDEQLLTDMDLLWETVRLGRTVRQHASLRVRQPLSELLVRATHGDGLRRFVRELGEELNVKEIRFLEVGDGLVVYHFKPNLPVIGKKYGPLIPAIRAALRALSGEQAMEAARKVEKGEAVELQVEGQWLHLLPDEVLVESSSPQGYAVAEGNGLLVALNTTLTAELLLEGQARDLVRFIQDARKTVGLAITDFIQVTLHPHKQVDLEPILAAYQAYICAETLTSVLRIGPLEEDEHKAHPYTVDVELAGGVVRVGIWRDMTGA